MSSFETLSNFFIVTLDGKIYRRSIDDNTGVLEFLFQSLYRSDLSIQAITVAQNGTCLKIAPNDVGLIYLVQQDVDFNILTVYTSLGSFVGAWNFPNNGQTVLGMSVWPTDVSQIVVITSNQMYFLGIANGILTYSISQLTLGFTVGLGLEVAAFVDGNDVQYYATNNIPPFSLYAITANNVTYSVSLSGPNPIAERIHPGLRGLFSIPNNINNLSGFPSQIYTIETELNGTEIHLLDGGSPAIPTNQYTKHTILPDLPFSPLCTCGEVSITGNTDMIPPPVLNIAVITRQYISSKPQKTDQLFFGNLQPGTTSLTQIVDMRVKGAFQISGVKIGIVQNAAGGHSPSEVFLVAHSQQLNTSLIPSQYFPGLNTDATPTNANNVSVGTKLGIGDTVPVESDYIYLAASAPVDLAGTGVCEYRWFFDFELP